MKVHMEKVKFNTYDMSKKDSISIAFLYSTLPGRVLLSVIIRPIFSKVFGGIMNRRFSKIFIRRFVKKNGIDMSEFKRSEFSSFNDFFSREINDGYRPMPPEKSDVAAPCDGKLCAYEITVDQAFKIKNSVYDVDALLQDKELAEDFTNGTCLIFRLMPYDYHRYCYIDDGEVISRKKIKGKLHTVRPYVLQKYKVYKQNTREYEVLNTENFGKVVQMEVGALFVGRIINHVRKRRFKRGTEKGMFEFGGSTIVMLFQENAISIEGVIFENTKSNLETIVKMGTKIGCKGAEAV